MYNVARLPPTALAVETRGRSNTVILLIVFQHLAVVGVGDEQLCRAVDRLGLAPALGVEGVARGIAGAAGAREPVLGVVAQGVGAVGGCIAVLPSEVGITAPTAVYWLRLFAV